MPESSDIRLVGKRAGIYLPECRAYSGESGEESLAPIPSPYDTPFAGHMYIIDDLRSVLKGEKEPIIRPEQTLNVTRIIELFYRSAELGKECFAQ